MPDKIADQIYCDWVQEEPAEDETWETSCGNAYILLEGTPKENDYNFCPGCGRHVRQI